MIDRRIFIIGTGALLIAPCFAQAQRPSGLSRVGYMALPTSTPNDRLAAFRQSLRELGYIEGKNLVIEYRTAEGKYERFPEIAQELVRLKVNVILADDGTPSAIAARNATSTIPVVFTVVNDPVASGVVKALGHPGGNLTGLSLQSPETTAKRLQMLKEIIPSARRVAVLVNPGNESMEVWRQALPTAAGKLNIDLIVVEARTVGEIDTVFQRAAGNTVDAMIVFDDALFYAQAPRLGALATRNRLPVMGGNSVIAEAGCLASYGANRLELVRRSAIFVDKILKGANPGDLPIEQASKFDLIINLQAARALAIDIPRAILLRADKVIG